MRREFPSWSSVGAFCLQYYCQFDRRGNHPATHEWAVEAEAARRGRAASEQRALRGAARPLCAGAGLGLKGPLMRCWVIATPVELTVILEAERTNGGPGWEFAPH